MILVTLSSSDTPSRSSVVAQVRLRRSSPRVPLVSLAFQVLSLEHTHLTERLKLLTLIILGEGISPYFLLSPYRGSFLGILLNVDTGIVIIAKNVTLLVKNHAYTYFSEFPLHQNDGCLRIGLAC